MIPKTKAVDAIKDIQNIFEDRAQSEFVLAKIERDGQVLITSGVDPAVGHMIVGTVAALRFDAEQFFDHFRISCTLSSERTIRKNFAVLCSRIGFVRQSHELAQELASQYPDDIDLLRYALASALDGMAIPTAATLINQLKQLGVDVTADMSFFPISRFDRPIELMAALGLKREQLVERIDIAAAVLRNKKEPIFGTVFDISPRGTFSYGFSVKADLEAMVELNMLIADKLLASFDDTLVDFFTITCVTHRDALQARRLSEHSEAV